MGDWCSLGRTTLTTDGSDLECPNNTFCSNSTVITPTPCYCDAETNDCSYCPAGSYQQTPCPAGYFCQGPANKEECKLSKILMVTLPENWFFLFLAQYCPPGTINPQICPAGYYCPDPTQQIICPKGYYCKLGSIFPTGIL